MTRYFTVQVLETDDSDEQGVGDAGVSFVSKEAVG